MHVPEKNLCEIQAESTIGTTFYRCFLKAKTISLEDGFSGHDKLPGGFLIAAMISALYSYKGPKGCKTFSIKDLGTNAKSKENINSYCYLLYNWKFVISYLEDW